MDKEIVEKVKKTIESSTPVMLDPIPLFIMSNNIMKKRNEAYALSITAMQKSLEKSWENYKKWFSIPYHLEYKYYDNNWLKRHGYPMRRRH